VGEDALLLLPDNIQFLIKTIRKKQKARSVDRALFTLKKQDLPLANHEKETATAGFRNDVTNGRLCCHNGKNYTL
jgi:hypothetical protein